ncbi:MAG: 1-(5-phosphoribosyl)-5-[(5-phosphoribosylamino)methylideneamino]imidazole-4-carboxamide isomerase [Eubacteriales bacterium]|nr:1-(5-phosphoribosyl)-5-[(5-phosphoribosylamino)methylideneamino]imidazole-4-carboxamide isomerase [Eubacteriales bacterium]
MLIFPAIDLYEGHAVRLYKGDYSRMTVYSDDPLSVAEDFRQKGAGQIHLVDLEGARSGGTPNLGTVCRIKERTGLFCEVGGGIRSMEVADAYIGAGVDRVILGTAAVTNEDFAARAAERYGDKIAVGIDVRDGKVAIRGWTETSALDAVEFCRRMKSLGITTFICTDISKDGAMRGANHDMYRAFSEVGGIDLIASGGVSSLSDVRALAAAGLYGAIIGKAYYTGDIDLTGAIEAAK